MKEIYMEKTNVNGKRQYYRYLIDGATAHFNWGEIGTDNPQSENRTFTEGKNIGKKNEKTPEQCCLEDTVTRARKKYEKGYEVLKGMDIIEENVNKNVQASDLSVPKPMKANDLKNHKKKIEAWDTVWVQPKLDGNRGLCNISTAKLYSSGRKEISHLPEIVELIKESASDIADAIEYLDGELYSEKLVFNDLQTALRRWKNTDKEGTAELQDAVKYYVFDVVSDKEWPERLELLNKVKENSKVIVVPTYKIKASEIDEYHEKFIEMGYEGIMVRLPGYSYEQKKSLGMFKYKLFDDEEYPVVGFEPQEHDPTKLGAAVLQMPNGATFTARPAMTDAFKEEIWNNQEKFMGRKATIKFQGKYEDTDKPRFTRLIKFRLPEDIT